MVQNKSNHDTVTILTYVYIVVVGGRESVVAFAIRYMLESPGIESRWGRVFLHTVQIDSGAHPASYTIGIGSLCRG
jgi:hypothetical protein